MIHSTSIFQFASDAGPNVLPAQPHMCRDMYLGMRCKDWTTMTDVSPEGNDCWIQPFKGIYGSYVPWYDSWESAVQGLMLHEKSMLYGDPSHARMVAANDPNALVVHMQLGHNRITEYSAAGTITRDAVRGKWRIYEPIHLAEVRHRTREVTLLATSDIPWPHAETDVYLAQNLRRIGQHLEAEELHLNLQLADHAANSSADNLRSNTRSRSDRSRSRS